MAGLQLCGKQSEKPYFIKNIKKNVYSLEEINYFLYNHINQVYRDFFEAPLFDYIDKELGRPDIADKLRSLDEKGASTKDFITYLLTVSKYYSHHELEHIANVVANIDNMTGAERQKMEADSLYRNKKYASALQMYNRILDAKDKDKLDNHFYGRIAYAIGTIYARMFMSKNANNYFAYAYRLDPGPKYSKACVYMSVLNNDDEELLNTIITYKITDEQLSAIRAAIHAARNEIENSEELLDFMSEFTGSGNYDSVIEGWKDEYYTMQS